MINGPAGDGHDDVLRHFFLYAMRAIVNKESDRKFFALAVLASLCAGVSFLLLIGAIGSIIL